MQCIYVTMCSIGVARIFSGVHFFLKKLTTFLVVLLSKQAENAKLTFSALQLSPAQLKLPKKVHFLPCLGDAPHNFFSALGYACAPKCTPWLRLLLAV